ncbi:retron Ec67 family RNA-directed DNA polymerase/endonuclease [Psychrosphaera haliotis]|nr:retron Ec67 family RNA-directed DNA polymerase/endonuclease [Psychrosphaera haliotis]
MSRLSNLQTVKTKPDLAHALKVEPVFLTRCLYVDKPQTQYHKFEIEKKSGGKRIICAPSKDLKSLQSALSSLLLDCIDEINKIKFPRSQLASPKMLSVTKKDHIAETLKIKVSSSEIKQPSLSHGFVRQRSIITNAMMHLGKKNVLNIDLENFFDSFNFGRVRGFFIKNRNFKLDPKIATVIAQIACYDNKLPQGSPCSPVITNLITHSLDIRLAALAKKYKCTYTRYADDITFSTRKSVFPPEIMNELEGEYITGKELTWDIEHAGFSINEKKTRIQYKDSRQDVTGLIVNKRPNTKKEYWRTARAKCNTLFKTGKFKSIDEGVEVDGNLNELEGQLNFIDQVDHYNRIRQKPPLMPELQLKPIGKNTSKLLTGREKTFSRFLFYRLFYGNDKPTILCEGKTDNVYLKSAISELKASYPKLAMGTGDGYQLLLRFVEYSKRTRFLLELFGGTDYLGGFIRNYESRLKFYNAPKPQHPTIIFLDNDKGSDKIISPLKNELKKIITLVPPQPDTPKAMHQCDFIHVVENLYVIFTPLGTANCDTDIEYFFDDAARLMKHTTGHCFNTVKNRNSKTDLSKDAFANHIVKAQKKKIKFDGFKPLLERIVKVIDHYDSIK